MFPLLPNSCTSQASILPVKKKKTQVHNMFLSSVHTVLVFVCSVNSWLKDAHVIHRRRGHFTAMFHFRTLFILLLFYVRTRLWLDIMCVCLCFSSARLCDSLSDHCIRFSGNLQDSPHAPQTWVDEKHEWQDSWLSEQLMKMVRRGEEGSKKEWTPFFLFYSFQRGERRWGIQISQETQRE